MKYALSTAALLLGLFPAAVAQQNATNKEHALETPRAQITHVASAMAQNPGRVEILGTNLGLLTSAYVNGVEVPIVGNDGHRMVIAPPDQNPGFGRLDLSNPAQLLTKRIEFTPSLSGRWIQNNYVSLRLNLGEPGWYVIHYSFRQLPEPYRTEGTYYAQMLDLTTPYSGEICGGSCADGNPMALPPIAVPRGILLHGALGPRLPMRVQAFVNYDGEPCWSNMYTLQPTL